MLHTLFLIVVSAFPAQPTEREEPKAAPAPRESAATLTEGLWPSARLQRVLLLRAVDDISYQYDLDQDQKQELQELLTHRWEPFLEKNRSKIEPIASEFLDMRLGLEPPSAERMKAWAERAAPVFDSFRTQINEGSSEFRKVLRPAQRAKFELETLKLNAGLGVAEHRLKRLRAGGFDPKEFQEFWLPSAAERQRRRNRPTRAAKVVQEEEKGPADQISLELASWDTYVAEFIRIYKLDEGQRNAALSCLSELKQRATDHRERRRGDIAHLEERIANATGDKEELADLTKQLRELYGPIDDMFQELKRRIEPIPTAEQRAAVNTTRDGGGSSSERNASRRPRDEDPDR